MIAVLTAREMRELDRHTIEDLGVPGPVLMEAAGRGVFRHLWESYGDRVAEGHTVVVCGRGNNGGDGFVVSRCLANRGCRVTVVLLGRSARVGGDAAIHLGAYRAAGGAVVEAEGDGVDEAATVVAGADLLVDAVVGTGLTDDLRGRAAEAVAWLNAASAPVISIDLPSGVNSDTGRVCGAAVCAEFTVTFAFPKRGHLLFPGASHTGILRVEEIGIPPGALERIDPRVFLWDGPDDLEMLATTPDAHKGTFGHVWVVGGSRGKVGAPGLAAMGALRTGAGLATVVAPGGLDFEARLPLEVMTAPLGDGREWAGDQWGEVADGLISADAIVVGPGLGVSEGAGAFLEALFREGRCPLVLDAGALRLLHLHPELWRDGCPAVLTPHPGEAARLLGTTPREVQADRVGALRTLADRFGTVVVLKGANSLVAAPDEPAWFVGGVNPGLATAGTGDVLSGVIAALLARGVAPLDSARLGVALHARAGAEAAERLGYDGMTATDVLDHLPTAFRSFSELRAGRLSSVPRDPSKTGVARAALRGTRPLLPGVA